MGGDIRVDSVPGEGSRFIVRLMLSQPLTPPVETEEPDAITGYLGRTRQMVLIDDDAAHLAMLTGLLEPLGFTVHTAGDGAAGLALAARVQPDLILLDVSLPGQSGWDIATQLRQRHGPVVRIVMLSGEVDSPDTPLPDGPANDMFVMKPFAFATLLDVIAAQLGLVWVPSQRASSPALGARPDATVLSAALAAHARPHLAEIERLVQIGHVRAIEAEIDAIAALDPRAMPAADRMRTYLDSFDLKALSTFAKAGQNDAR
jgi:CheY-like chemotaxis protein